jgi:hypothetical protein
MSSLIRGQILRNASIAIIQTAQQQAAKTLQLPQ